jgi:hypothetical protein
VLKAVSPRPPLIGGYYFQHRTPGHTHYIMPVSPSRWEWWREDWALVQVDVHDRLTLPVGGPTPDRTEWEKTHGLEPGFDPVLDQIQYLAENGLTLLMVLHNFLSKCLVPLQDRSHHPAWMYTGVNDIMRLDCGPGSSQGDALLAASLKALTTDQPSAELVMPTAACEPLCVNQAARTALLAIMPTLDDVGIAPMQRGDQSRGVVIPGLGGPSGAAGGHGRGGGTRAGRGGIPAGGGPAGSRSGTPASGRGGSPAGNSSPTAAPGKGKQAHVILDDDEVSFDEDEPLQKRLQQLFGAGSVVLDEAATMMATADKEAVDKRAEEEATVKRAVEERAAEEAAAKAAAAEDVTSKTTDEAIGAARGSPAPNQAPSVAGAKRTAAPNGSTPPAKRPYRGIWKPRFVQLSLFSPFFHWGFIL